MERPDRKVHCEPDGQQNGFEWWLKTDASLSQERHWYKG
jgi:hypothetical protein